MLRFNISSSQLKLLNMQFHWKSIQNYRKQKLHSRNYVRALFNFYSEEKLLSMEKLTGPETRIDFARLHGRVQSNWNSRDHERTARKSRTQRNRRNECHVTRWNHVTTTWRIKYRAKERQREGEKGRSCRTRDLTVITSIYSYQVNTARTLSVWLLSRFPDCDI